MNILDSIHRQFTVPVIRHQSAGELEHICRALIDGGLTVLEITLMSEAVFGVIRKLSSEKGLLIGAGTVLTEDHAKRAMDAGAQFLVSPGTPENCLAFAKKQGITFIPGVLTPTEIMRARELGADLVKVFPISSVGGATYLKYLRGPFPDLKCMVTGGISLEQIQAYLAAGSHSVGLGNHLTKPELIAKSDWKALTGLAADHVTAVTQARAKSLSHP